MTIPPLSVAAARLSPLMTATLAALSLAAVAAAGFALYAVLGPKSEVAQSSAQDWKPPTFAIVDLPPPKPSGADVQTLTRPIFSKNRKPAPKATPGAAKANPTLEATTDAPSDFTLAAIVKHGGVSNAFIISGGAPDGEWKKIGDTINSWTVAAISETELTLKNGDQAVTLRLFPETPQ